MTGSTALVHPNRSGTHSALPYGYGFRNATLHSDPSDAVVSRPVLWHATKRIAICTTPKIACTEIFDYVRWLEVGPPEACRFGVWHVPESEAVCRSFNRSRWGHAPGGGVYDFHDNPPLSFSPHLPPPGWMYLVPVRDPWDRLVSAFRSKYIKYPPQKCNAISEHERGVCFQRKWPELNFSLDAAQSPLQRYFAAVTGGGTAILNPHWALQSQLCLREQADKEAAARRPIALPIDRGGLDILSMVLGHKRSFSQVMGGRYSHEEMPCYEVSGAVLGAVRDFLAPDYELLRTSFFIEYASSALLHRAAAFGSSRICVENSTIHPVAATAERARPTPTP